MTPEVLTMWGFASPDAQDLSDTTQEPSHESILSQGLSGSRCIGIFGNGVCRVVLCGWRRMLSWQTAVLLVALRMRGKHKR